MKKQYGFCRTALLLCAWLFSSAVWAWTYNFEADGIYYYILSSDDKTVEVTHTPYSDDGYSGKVTIPATVTYEKTEYRVIAIGESAFASYDGLTSVTIPESVTTIGDKAFSDCSGLEKFEGKFASDNGRCLIVNDTLKAFAPSGLTQYTIPDEVKVIGYRAFEWCTGLTEITIGESVTTIGDEAFDFCRGLTSVTIGESVTTIGDNAFYFCTGLTSVTIPESVTTIGNWAFEWCTGLTEITIPESVTTIGSNAFYICDGLTEFKGKFASTDNRCLVINDTLVSFAPSGLTQYTIPDNVKVIGYRAFGGCYGLTSITIPDGVTAIDYGAFGGCDGLTSITIPESVTTIGNWAFSDCDGLTSVTIPNSVTSIGNWAFYRCDGLTEITIPNSITAIGDDVFFGCSGLTEVMIPNSVTTIGNGAFSHCDGLTSVTIPESVTTIGNWAFRYCENLTSVTVYNPEPVDINIVVFAGVDCTKCKLYVPKGSVEAYRNAAGWREFGEILPIDESSAITEIRQEQDAEHITVYNLQGVLVLETDDAAALKTLQNGAYIVNGKKMIIAR